MSTQRPCVCSDVLFATCNIITSFLAGLGITEPTACFVHRDTQCAAKLHNMSATTLLLLSFYHLGATNRLLQIIAPADTRACSAFGSGMASPDSTACCTSCPCTYYCLTSECETATASEDRIRLDIPGCQCMLDVVQARLALMQPRKVPRGTQTEVQQMEGSSLFTPCTS